MTKFLPFALLALACHELSPAQQAKLDLFECQAAALAPLVEPAIDSAKLARDLYVGGADLGLVFAHLNATQAEVTQTLDALRACTTAALPVREPPPELTPAVLHAPPPAYGNKVL